jgi:pimeloyl-ACP methyl ester carboxylesterase
MDGVITVSVLGPLEALRAGRAVGLGGRQQRGLLALLAHPRGGCGDGRVATASLGAVSIPALVLHRRGDRTIPIEHGYEVAARIPDARFVALAGRDHFPWLGDVGSVLKYVTSFLESGELATEAVQSS